MKKKTLYSWALSICAISFLGYANAEDAIDTKVMENAVVEKTIANEAETKDKELKDKELKAQEVQAKETSVADAQPIESELESFAPLDAEGIAPLTVKSPTNAKASLAPELSPNDKRLVEYLVLANNLPVLLISDPTAEKAAAALDVNVGSGDDPLDRAGLAHFLEHMLFLGTKKYPNAEEYQAYIQQYGGQHNAYTAIDRTNYFFEVNADNLAGSLDRFAQFFIAPLFNEEYVERERNAVHSEFRAKYSTEFRRREDVLRQITNPEHPLGRFRTGNLNSLHNNNGELRSALIDFYNQYYAAGNMRLVVAGKESLDELKKLVLPLFSQIKDFEVTHKPAPSKLYQDDLLPASINIVPYSEVRTVAYRFVIPKSTEWMKKPTSYLGFLLGHEGKGSLLWLLQQQGWASVLSAGQSEGWRDGGTFTISIQLTPEGLKHLDEIDTLLFEHIDKVFKEGIESWRFDEIKKLGEIDFHFKERSGLMMEVSHLAGRMQEVESRNLFSADYRLSDFDEPLIRSYSQFINRESLLRIVTAPELAKPDLPITPLYQTPYFLVADYSSAKVKLDQALTKGRSLPEENEFVPAALTMIEAENNKPARLYKYSRFKAWHAENTEFDVPKAIVRIRVKSALVEQDAQHAALMALLSRVLRADLNPVAYQAAMAGANFSVSETSRGVDFSLSGYSDSLDPLLDYALQRIKLFTKGDGKLADVSAVKSIQDELVRSYRNQKKSTPYRQVMRYLATLIYAPYWQADETADAVESITHEALVAFTKELFKKSEVTVLSSGNIEQRHAKKMAKKIKKSLVKGRSFKPKVQAKVSRVTGLHKLDIEAEHEDNAAMVYLQGKDDSMQERAAMELMAHMLSAPFYSQLRTEQQLGYIVFASYYPVRDMPGVVFAVQSPKTNVQGIKKAMDNFLSDYSPDFETEFRVHQLALVAELSKAPKNLAEKTSRYWQSVNNADWQFDNNDKLIEAVEAIEPGVFAKWYKATLDRMNKDALLLYSQAQTNSEEKPVFESIPAIKSAAEFKAKLESVVYP